MQVVESWRKLAVRVSLAHEHEAGRVVGGDLSLVHDEKNPARDTIWHRGRGEH